MGELTIYVTKADGARQAFDRTRIVKTCLRMGATSEVAEEIARRIEAKIYDGMETKEILRATFTLLRERKPSTKHHIDLRRALSLLRSKPDFERFVQILLAEEGYEVTPNQIVRGRCVEHEIDAIARRNGQTYIVEVKRHHDYHTPTGLDEARIARAVFEDIAEGFEAGLNNVKVDKAMIVCNTRFSEHADRYARCRGIQHIGWNSPSERDLETMIRERKLHPVTYLRDLGATTRDRLVSIGIVMLKQLVDQQPGELAKQAGISEADAELMIERATAVLDNL